MKGQHLMLSLTNDVEFARTNDAVHHLHFPLHLAPASPPPLSSSPRCDVVHCRIKTGLGSSAEYGAIKELLLLPQIAVLGERVSRSRSILSASLPPSSSSHAFIELFSASGWDMEPPACCEEIFSSLAILFLPAAKPSSSYRAPIFFYLLSS